MGNSHSGDAVPIGMGGRGFSPVGVGGSGRSRSGIRLRTENTPLSWSAGSGGWGAPISRVLHELALTRRSSPERSSPANEVPKAPSLVPAPSPIDRLVLDPGLDFVFHKDGMIELTEAGFRRMGQAHSAGLDTVIEVDRRYLLHLPASKPKFA